MELFDTHCHYNDESFDQDREEIIKSTYEAGVTSVVCIGTNVNDSKYAVELAKENNYIYATVRSSS